MVTENQHADARIITHGLSISPKHETQIQQAVGFATCAHRHQKRKYTGEPYVNHCIAVARLVAASGAAVPSIIAAVLHDTIEDTKVTFEEIFDHFGQETAILVLEVTSPGTVKDRLRDVRHQVNLTHLKKISAHAATIKIADIIDNTSTIHERDSKFALTYLSEKWDALDVLMHGNPDLHARARAQVICNLLAAKHSVYPLPLGPYSGAQYIMPPSEYEKDIFAIVRAGDGGGIIVIWRHGAWQHSNADLGSLMWASQLTSQHLAQAGIPCEL